MNKTGAELFVKALKQEGINTLFAYPGGFAVDLFDALYDDQDIKVILPRHEQALIHAADGYARSTGKVGVCLVTSGPGATNLITGIATANFDSVPLVCFTGQVPLHLIGNDAFQEVDIVGMTRNISKYSITVRDRKDLGRIIKEAFYIAQSGKPGPVIVDIPKDIQQAYGDDDSPVQINIRGYKPNTNIHLGQLKKAMAELNQAKKPVLLAGGGVHIAHAEKEFKALAEMLNAPVVTTIMGKGVIPTSHPLYIGNIGMHGSYASNQAISECDLLFSIGTRFNDRITGSVEAFAPNAKLVHVDIDPASISRNIVVDIPVVADAKTAIKAMLELAQPLTVQSWLNTINVWKKAYPVNMKQYHGMTPEVILNKLNKLFDQSIIVTDVGQNQLWTTQYIELDENRKLLTSGGFGTMGYGLPAAIGAQLGNPDKKVICISGDGGIQMNIQEFATAVAYRLPIIICIFNNYCLGNVRQWQEMFFQKRYSATILKNVEDQSYLPDFIKLAESYDALGVRVTDIDEIVPAFSLARAIHNRPTVIEFMIEQEVNVLPIVPPGSALKDSIMEY